jgi:hypothetical protein
MNNLTKLYSDFAEGIRPFGRMTAFELGQQASAVTYDLLFDPDMQFQELRTRTTRAMMVGTLTPEKAIQKTSQDKPDRLLQPWVDAFASEQEKDRNISFELITYRATNLITQELYKKAIENQLDLVFRADQSKHATLFNQNAYFGSLAKVASRPSQDFWKWEKPVTPATAGRKLADFHNIHVLHNFIETGGENTLPEGTSLGVANYKRHLAWWKNQHASEYCAA